MPPVPVGVTNMESCANFPLQGPQQQQQLSRFDLCVLQPPLRPLLGHSNRAAHH